MEKLLLEEYGLEVTALEKSAVGAGSDTWFVTCKDGRYVMKYPCESEINHPEQEPMLCEYLLKCGIPACQFLKNKHDEYLSKDSQGRVFHVQRFIEGRMCEWNTAPKWLLMQSAAMLGRIHTVLKNYWGLPIGIGEDFFRCMTPENALKSYENSLRIAMEQKDEEVIKDLQYRIELMRSFPEYKFDTRRLTCQSTHGDYFISQLLCGENKINAVIDWTTACVHPVVWEIVRSYVYAAPSCKDGDIAIEEFVQYVGEYCKYAELSEYDIENMAAVFYYQIAVCDYYGQYYGTDADNRYIYLQQARLSTKLLKWFEKNEKELKLCLHQYWKKQSLQVIGRQ
ncbi:MAG: phosphotransferase [Lachnospiraceae bacterium]|nr:phosphotransferase [Lachnospiraceae bacterium]